MTEDAPRHPGRILFEEVMTPLGVSRNKLARDIDVPVGRISDIVAGKRGVTPDTALRFARYFGTAPELWLSLQSEYDLHIARTTTWPAVERSVAILNEPGSALGSPAPGAADPAPPPVEKADPSPAAAPATAPKAVERSPAVAAPRPVAEARPPAEDVQTRPASAAPSAPRPAPFTVVSNPTPPGAAEQRPAPTQAPYRTDEPSGFDVPVPPAARPPSQALVPGKPEDDGPLLLEDELPLDDGNGPPAEETADAADDIEIPDPAHARRPPLEG